MPAEPRRRARAASRAVILLAFSLALMPGVAPAREIEDSLGRMVSVPENPSRIVSLAPNITEILFAVGAGGQVVGVTDYCDEPAEAAVRARVGGFVNPSLEIITSLRPDLVIATADGNRPADVLAAERLGLPVYVADAGTIDEILESIGAIGRLTGHGERAADLAASMSRRREEIARAKRAAPAPRVLFIVGFNPLVGVGPGTFIDHLISEAGGANVLSATPARYPLLGLEGLLAADPDLIIIDVMEGKGGARKLPAGWESLRAVREGKVRQISDDSLLRPGPRIMEGLAALGRIINGSGGRLGRGEK